MLTWKQLLQKHSGLSSRITLLTSFSPFQKLRCFKKGCNTHVRNSSSLKSIGTPRRTCPKSETDSRKGDGSQSETRGPKTCSKSAPSKTTAAFIDVKRVVRRGPLTGGKRSSGIGRTSLNDKHPTNERPAYILL